jgi:polyisoprenoid-binding protein YceI
MTSSTWTIDPTHTDVVFSAKHMMVTTVRGKFASVSGVIEGDPQDPAAAKGTFTVDVASLNTGVEQRDGHLRSADFLDADRFPTATFVSAKVEPKGGSGYRATGDLTIRGITRPVTFEVEVLGVYAGLDGSRRVGLHAEARINREDFGLTWNVALESGGWLVGKEIKLELDIAAEESVAATAETTGIAAAA